MIKVLRICAYMGLSAVQLNHTPMYPVIDAARYLRIPSGTLQAWLRGRTYQTKDGQQFAKPLIQRPNPKFSQLSFINLVEAHVLRVIRQDHQIRLDKVRTALDYVESSLGLVHPLAMAKFETDGVDLFVDTIDNLINVSRAGQLAMKKVLKDLLTRIEWDESGIAKRLFPIVPFPQQESINQPPLNITPVWIDPHISFGKPTIAGTGIPTDVIVDLFNAGDEVEAIAEDYNCKVEQIYAAIWFETSCLAA